MSSGPSDNRVPTPGHFPDEVKGLILDAWQPDWTRPGHEKYQEAVNKNPKNAESAVKIASILRDMEGPQVDQALAALEDAGYRLVKIGPLGD